MELDRLARWRGRHESHVVSVPQILRVTKRRADVANIGVRDPATFKLEPTRDDDVRCVCAKLWHMAVQGSPLHGSVLALSLNVEPWGRTFRSGNQSPKEGTSVAAPGGTACHQCAQGRIRLQPSADRHNLLAVDEGTERIGKAMRGGPDVTGRAITKGAQPFIEPLRPQDVRPALAFRLAAASDPVSDQRIGPMGAGAGSSSIPARCTDLAGPRCHSPLSRTPAAARVSCRTRRVSPIVRPKASS